MKTLLTLLAAAGLAGAALAQQPAPGPENQKLAVWYGDWTYTGETFATPAGPAGKVTGRMIGRPVQNGFAGEFISDETGPTGETHYLEIDFWDPAIKDHGYIILGNDGYVERGSFTMKGNLTTNEYTIMVDGRPQKLRAAETVAPDGRSYTKRSEVLTEGKNWVPCSEYKFTKVGAPTTEQELIKLEEDWAKAYVARDLKTLRRMEADDWAYTDADGNVIPRAQDLADVESGTFVATSFVVDQLKVRVYGDTAVVTGRQTMKATYKGKPANETLRLTDTWIRRSGSWQCIGSHLSRIAPP